MKTFPLKNPIGDPWLGPVTDLGSCKETTLPSKNQSKKDNNVDMMSLLILIIFL